MCHVHAEAEEFAHVFIFETGSVRPAWMLGCWESQRQDFVFGLVQRRFMLSDVRLGPTDFTSLRVYTYISVYIRYIHFAMFLQMNQTLNCYEVIP